MKIKGIKTGAQRGDIIQLGPKEKVAEAVKSHIPSMSAPSELWWAEDVTVGEVSITKGRPIKKDYENNTYQATGTFKVRKLKQADGTDKLLKVVPMSYKIILKDILDKNGMPDLEVLTYEDQQLQPSA